jgi:hypothetical protein
MGSRLSRSRVPSSACSKPSIQRSRPPLVRGPLRVRDGMG